MSTGKVSNYLDSGYNVSSLSFYDTSQNIISSATTGSDIYTNSQIAGVIMIDLNHNAFLIYCSVPDLTYIGAPTPGSGGYGDDYYIVYPGWGFTLYTSLNYGGTSTRKYINNTTSPILFTPYTIGSVSPNIYTTSGNIYTVNTTYSIKIYFRGTEVTVTGLS